MPTVKTGYWIRVKNGSVIEVWDYAPPVEEIEAGVGWCEAVEIFPDVIENREIITTHTINIDQSSRRDCLVKAGTITVDERKSLLIRLAKGNFQEVVDDELKVELNDTDASGDLEAVSAAKAVKDARIAAINAATTHEEVDLL
jgi:hypothetical protein